jgi:hypothetical protein
VKLPRVRCTRRTRIPAVCECTQREIAHELRDNRHRKRSSSLTVADCGRIVQSKTLRVLTRLVSELRCGANLLREKKDRVDRLRPQAARHAISCMQLVRVPSSLVHVHFGRVVGSVRGMPQLRLGHCGQGMTALTTHPPAYALVCCSPPFAPEYHGAARAHVTVRHVRSSPNKRPFA